MRRSALLSALLHAVILILVIVGLPRWQSPIEVAPAIPVEVVTVAEKSLAPKAEPKPQPVKPEPPKPEPPKPEPPKPEPVAEIPPAPAPPVPPEPEPQPVPKEVAVAQPQPAPEPVPLPKPEVKPPEPKPEVKEPEPPKPQAKPKPPAPKKPLEKKPAEVATPSFLKTVEKLRQQTELTKTEPPKPQPQPQPTAAPPASIDDRAAINRLEAAIREQVEQCWNVPAGARDATDLIVEIRVLLNRDGSVLDARIVDTTRAASDTFYRTAAESARRAVLLCSPLRNLPPDRYDAWRDITLRFDPKEMLGT